MTVRQTIVPERLLGRVNAGARVVSAGGQLMGTVVGAVIAEALGLRPALFVAAGLGFVGAGVLAASAVRRLTELPAPIPTAGSAEAAPTADAGAGAHAASPAEASVEAPVDTL